MNPSDVLAKLIADNKIELAAKHYAPNPTEQRRAMRLYSAREAQRQRAMADEHNDNGHVETSGIGSGELVKQQHGGAIRNGGGNPKRNGGRTPSKLRARMRGSLAKRLIIACTIADDPETTTTDKLRALDFLAKYGLGTTVTETDTDGNDAPRPQVIAYIPENGRVSRF